MAVNPKFQPRIRPFAWEAIKQIRAYMLRTRLVEWTDREIAEYALVDTAKRLTERNGHET